jgi:hypothetical protein
VSSLGFAAQHALDPDVGRISNPSYGSLTV